MAARRIRAFLLAACLTAFTIARVVLIPALAVFPVAHGTCCIIADSCGDFRPHLGKQTWPSVANSAGRARRGRNISHAHNVTPRRFEPNLQRVKALVNGAVRRPRLHALPPLEQDRQSRVTAMRTAVSTDSAPKAIGPYSQAVRAGRLLFISGQIPIDPATGNLIAGDIAAMTHRVFANIKAIRAAGATLDQVVRTTVFLADKTTSWQ